MRSCCVHVDTEIVLRISLDGYAVVTYSIISHVRLCNLFVMRATDYHRMPGSDRQKLS